MHANLAVRRRVVQYPTIMPSSYELIWTCREVSHVSIPNLDVIEPGRASTLQYIFSRGTGDNGPNVPTVGQLRNFVNGAQARRSCTQSQVTRA